MRTRHPTRRARGRRESCRGSRGMGGVSHCVSGDLSVSTLFKGEIVTLRRRHCPARGATARPRRAQAPHPPTPPPRSAAGRAGRRRAHTHARRTGAARPAAPGAPQPRVADTHRATRSHLRPLLGTTKHRVAARPGRAPLTDPILPAPSAALPPAPATFLVMCPR